MKHFIVHLILAVSFFDLWTVRAAHGRFKSRDALRFKQFTGIT